MVLISVLSSYMLTSIFKNVTFFLRHSNYQKLLVQLFIEPVNIYKIVEIIAKIILYFRLISLDSDKDKLLTLVVIAVPK